LFFRILVYPSKEIMPSEPEKYAIITAGGKGERTGLPFPKQFMELKGLPLIMHSIYAFLAYSPKIKLIVVLPAGMGKSWEELCRKYRFEHVHTVCTGGETRFHSVRNGLAHAESGSLVAIHDAARPLVSTALISRCFSMAAQKGTAVPVIPQTDSVREVIGKENRRVDRSRLVMVQTPQVFETNLIKAAYEQPWDPSFTDDACVLEAGGERIWLVEGEARNIKVTTKTDLAVAGALMRDAR
jgi:2-C-methyl-D-erythritol 4-phosphate cytidylyltransferase